MSTVETLLSMLAIYFLSAGSVYFTIGTIDKIKWWNGIDENGNPK